MFPPSFQVNCGFCHKTTLLILPETFQYLGTFQPTGSVRTIDHGMSVVLSITIKMIDLGDNRSGDGTTCERISS